MREINSRQPEQVECPLRQLLFVTLARMSSTSPHWTPLAARACPRLWRDWLVDKGSLTQRLQALGGNSFEVVLLRQAWSRPRPDEARVLGIRDDQLALVREVVLRGRGRDWVYARSIVPRQAVEGRMRCLRRLGNRPLGEWLFRHPATRRGPILVARWPSALLPTRCRQGDRRPVWARCSVFHLGQARLLVSEIFLPALAESLPLE